MVTVNLYREADKKKKKDKNLLIGELYTYDWHIHYVCEVLQLITI